ncbi:HNH endonuclease signature motif containing protein [Actinomadura roseirufa]|uniref:HNH endonuclease signature motif containing protein n=1 Tax=Actinomadura roseirufa TaxID=2094049 RepID=UPI00104190D0|nr:HNH endonuclease signature motif containing protein [Actinomadura roseirufa]
MGGEGVVGGLADGGEWAGRGWFPPGPQLAVCLSGGRERLSDLSDGELLEVAAAARRQTAWAQARELAAIAELTRRRTSDEREPDHRILSARESVTEEVATALVVTGNTAATLVHVAERLATELPGTRRALEAGHIDMAKARVICDGSERLPEGVAAQVETAVLDKAPGQTAGQLRRRLKRIVHRLAPEAVDERRKEAVTRRRLALCETPDGTADLSVLDLTPEDAQAVYNKISAAARGIKDDGDARTLHQIRADLAVRLLQGADLPGAVRDVLNPSGAPDAAPDAAPLTQTESSGDGDAAVEALADTVGMRLAHVERVTSRASLRGALERTVRGIHEELAERREAFCRGSDAEHGRTAHRPPAAMRREVQARHATCVFPTCNRRSQHCDLDHTTPWRPGITCRCNLAPLCRRHHRTKQSPGWGLHQLWPGLLVWITPSGGWKIVRPERQ